MHSLKDKFTQKKKKKKFVIVSHPIESQTFSV